MKTIITILLSLYIALPIKGQNIAAFSGTKSPEVATVQNISAEALTRGPVLTVAGGGTFNSGNWATGNKLDTNSYIEWSVKADPGYIIHITELQINFDRDPDGLSHFFTGNGPAKIRIRTSLDTYETDIYSNDKVSNSGLSPTIETTLTSASGGNIIFRLYGYSANIGMLGPLGTFDIEGGLGKVLGLDETGIRLSGNVKYDGLLYSDSTWTPKAPNSETGNENVFVTDGIYTETKKIKVKNLKVAEGAGIVIAKTGAITVNGNLTTASNVTLKSDADNFSSLIVKDTVIGTATYQRQINITTPLGGSGNTVLVSAPVTGEAFKLFRKSNLNILSNTAKTLSIFGPFNKVNGTYLTYSNNEKESLTPATGYRMTPAKNDKLTFTGNVNTVAVHKNIESLGPSHKEWNLIGNPYPSYIKASEFLAVNKSQFLPEFAGIYNYSGHPSNGWTILNSAYLTLNPKTEIEPGLGFMVASKMGGGTISFMPTMRSAGDHNVFKVDTKIVPKNVGFLKLNLTNGISNYQTDFYFNHQSTKGLDPGYDAGIYGGKAPDFAIFSHLVTENNEIDMAIQSLAYNELSNEVIVPLGINAPEGQYITIGIAESILPKQTEVYLEDKKLNRFILLTKNNYTFTSDSQVSGTGRFFLHFNNSVLSFGNNTEDSPQLFTTNASHTLQINGLIDSNTVISIFDQYGRLLLSNALDKSKINHNIDLSILDSGMYLVKLKNSSHDKILKVLIN